MKNVTFFKIALLIVLFGTVYHVVTPKYQIRNVSYYSNILSDSPNSGSEMNQEKELIRINRLTGQIERFSSWTTLIPGDISNDKKWVPLADEPPKKHGQKKS